MRPVEEVRDKDIEMKGGIWTTRLLTCVLRPRQMSGRKQDTGEENSESARMMGQTKKYGGTHGGRKRGKDVRTKKTRSQTTKLTCVSA